jgi:beta-lactamase family protein
MSEITWVNHASFIVRSESVALICDPWLEGSVFNNGWNLLSPTKFRFEDFRDITHIWFSHEHPDHFFPPNITKIPKEYRANIEVLYQQTEDRKVIQFCQKQGFKTRELSPGTPLTIGDVTLTSGPCVPADSWLLIETPEHVILNLNDCEVSTVEASQSIRQHTSRPIDVLLSQFSYACWEGNADETHRREYGARMLLQRLTMQLETIRPRTFIPAASFILFSHADNGFNNDAINKVHAVVDYLSEHTTGIEFVTLYPSDRWVPGTPHDSRAALDRYAADYARGVPSPHQAATVQWDALVAAGADHMTRVRKKNAAIWMWLANRPPVRFFAPASIYVTDLQRCARFDIFNGLREAPDLTPRDVDISLSSDSLNYALKFDWGMETLYVNACFQASQPGFKNFRRTLSVALLNNMGKTFGPSLVLNTELCVKAIGHFFPRVKPVMRKLLPSS